MPTVAHFISVYVEIATVTAFCVCLHVCARRATVLTRPQAEVFLEGSLFIHSKPTEMDL